MAETALRVSLQKLCDPLVLGLAFLYKVPDQVERLRFELERMHSFLKIIQNMGETDDMTNFGGANKRISS
ncbi:hypothetical protein AMTR_s00061p00205860 [Amborella trichopoda]|uniref:Rx N-terminal domain-containing protein n=1 Tax=Amborella trichopoda TaxID=13333 RepID=U5D9R8_AMBTC|nr:hypothetical protein AMTR_s00061p00205860 [Amborella trichopoda]